MAAEVDPAPSPDACELDRRRLDRTLGRRRGWGSRCFARHALLLWRLYVGWWPPSKSASAQRGRCSIGLVAEGGDPDAIVEAEGLAALDGGDDLAAVVAAALAANADAAERVKGGNAKAIGPMWATSCARPRVAPMAARSRALSTSSWASESGESSRPSADSPLRARRIVRPVRGFATQSKANRPARPRIRHSEHTRRPHFGLKAKHKRPSARQYAVHEQADLKFDGALHPGGFSYCPRTPPTLQVRESASDAIASQASDAPTAWIVRRRSARGTFLGCHSQRWRVGPSLVASPLLAVIGARPGRVSEPARPRAPYC